MYLKSLNVVGFKSFADRTTLEFHPGSHRHRRPQRLRQKQRPRQHPLGAGRAIGQGAARRRNEGRDLFRHRYAPAARHGRGVADLRRLREGHSASSTTKSRSPGAFSATAPSEYELNKTPCRLRDIHSLFMDTGIGRSAYSIMEQGKIDQILSSRPEDRRAIFEEAAGITKYKSQKKEALRKLENTEANLAPPGRHHPRSEAADRLAPAAGRQGAPLPGELRGTGRAGNAASAGTSSTLIPRRSPRCRPRWTARAQRQEELDSEVAGAGGESSRRRATSSPSSRRNWSACARSSRRHPQCPRTGRAARRDQSRARGGIHRPARPGAAGDRRHGGKSPRGRGTARPSQRAGGEFHPAARAKPQRRFDEEQETLQMLTAQIGASRRSGPSSRREARAGTAAPAAGAGTGRPRTPAAEFPTADRGAPGGAGGAGANAATRRRPRVGADTPRAGRRRRRSCRTARGAGSRRSRRGAKPRKNCATAEKRRSRSRPGASTIAGASRCAGATRGPARQRARRPRSGCSRSRRPAPSCTARSPSTLPSRPATKRRWRLLLGDAVNALVLNDDDAAQSWREKLDGKEQCAFAPLRAARPDAAALRRARPTPPVFSPRSRWWPTSSPRCSRTRTWSTISPPAGGSRRRSRRAPWPRGEGNSSPAAAAARRAGSGRVARRAHSPVGIAPARSRTCRRRPARLTEAQNPWAKPRAALEEKTAGVEQARAAVQEAEIALATQRQEERAAQSAVGADRPRRSRTPRAR